MKFRFLLFIIPWIICSLAAPAWVHANRLDRKEDYSLDYYEQQTLFGDWDGLRTSLHNRGFNVDLEYFGDFNGNVVGGGTKKAHATNYVEAEILINAERLIGWTGAQFFFLGYALSSTDPSVFINTRQTVSNLEATDTVKLFEAWWEQSLFSDHFSIKAGLYSLDTEFDFKETANLFVNGVFGTGIDLSEMGLQGPAIYPFSALGVRLKTEWDGLYLQTAVVDGIPGDPDNPHGTQVVLNDDDGFLIASEIGYKINSPDHPRLHLGVGAWVYTTELPDFDNPMRTQRGRHSIYGFIDLRLYSETPGNPQGLDAYFRAGVADKEAGRFKRHIAFGLAYTGLFPNRESDILGFAVSSGWAGDSFQNLNRSNGTPIEDEEIVLELTYILAPKPWLTLQPDIQWFIHPGLSRTVDNTLYLGLRTEVTF
jgi:porin